MEWSLMEFIKGVVCNLMLWIDYHITIFDIQVQAYSQSTVNLLDFVNTISADKDRTDRILSSCRAIRDETSKRSNGVYYVQDTDGIRYPVYCDMAVGGGGWTLVASIHENNIRSTGRCSVGDRWSSETGNEVGSHVGAENWMNLNTFGDVASATSDDYKNHAYFDLQARDVMIWQVPNDTPLANYSSAAYVQYHTSNGFLSRFGGNLYHCRRVDIVKDPVSDLIPEALDADTQDRNVENDQSNKDNAEKLHLKQDLQFKHVGIR